MTLVELGEAEGDEAAEAEGVASLKALKAEGDRRQLEALLSGEADPNDTYVEVHSGREAPRAATGRACSCACTCAGRSGESSTSS